MLPVDHIEVGDHISDCCPHSPLSRARPRGFQLKVYPASVFLHPLASFENQSENLGKRPYPEANRSAGLGVKYVCLEGWGKWS